MRQAIRLSTSLALLLLSCAVAVAEAPKDAGGTPEGLEFFEKNVRPVLVDHCQKCHGSSKQFAGLRLDSRQAMIAGGENGPVVVPGDPDQSPMIQAIRHDGDVRMPPRGGKLPEPAARALTDWVRMGAPWPADAELSGDAKAGAAADHWAFRPVRSVEPPAVGNLAWITSPIDAFILDRLEAKGLAPSPPADRRTLLRRVTFDLTGLPPTASEVEAFQDDATPDAYEKVIDRLLASPRYGERWGRHWLDVARYADTKGYVFTQDPRYPFAFTYRDYVIRAFNDDLPFDRFLVEQIAADRLPAGGDTRPLAALGFLTVGRRFLNNQDDIIDDRIDVVTRGLLGITVTCARCHDHKFDPIPTEDYYSLHGVFASSVEPENLPEIVQDGGAHPSRADYQAQRDRRQKAISDYHEARRAAIERDVREHLSGFLLAGHEFGFRSRDRKSEDAARAHKIDPSRLRWFAGRFGRYLEQTATGHDPVLAPWHALAALPEGEFGPKAAEAVARLAAADPKTSINPQVARILAAPPPNSMKEVVRRYADLWTQAAARPPGEPDWDALRALLDAPEGPFRLQADETRRAYNRAERDELTALTRKLAALDTEHPGAPTRAMVLNDAPKPVEPQIFLRGDPARRGRTVPRRFLKVLSGPERTPFRDGSGRLELAHAIVSPDNPLTARVMVNRLWMHHFGRGLVNTPGDFGIRSEPPTHPELLDWLASRFVEGGWSVKGMHRLILHSNAYKQASDDRSEARDVDPENLLVWRQKRRRLQFEAMRDSILAASGQLDESVGGRPVSITSEPFSTRRTVYAHIDRQKLDGLFRTFDFASTDASTPARHTTVVPQQALFLMNSPFVAEQARHLADRATRDAGPDRDPQVTALYRLALARPPESHEADLARRFLDARGTPAPEGPSPLEGLAQVLLLTNEFLYAD